MRGMRIATEGVRIGKWSKGMMLAKLLALSAVALSRTPASYSSSDIKHIQSFWKSPGRFEVQAPEERKNKGPWVVRLSAEGSVWIAAYNGLKGYSKAARAEHSDGETTSGWDTWVKQKVAYDRYQAGLAAAEANSRFLGEQTSNTVPQASDPGPEPDGLMHFAGEAPVFASAVVPNQYLVRFPDGAIVKMADNPPMRSDYPAYRFPQGVMSVGTPVRSLPQGEMDDLFQAAGIDASAQRVMKAVSMLEGGFDSVNTYDTGFVSVGLIQFACLSKGAGSLGQVLLEEKNDNPDQFRDDFHRFGLDVTEDGSLVALDIDNGYEKTGQQAAKQIINDKRLVAVFQHAGEASHAFRVAQLKVAKNEYYPLNDTITVTSNGQTITGKVCDFVHSEAGMATLMDRKVNTGKLDPLSYVLSQVANEHGCRTVSDLAAYEKEVVTDCRYRRDYTQDLSLSQPAELSTEELGARHGGSRSRRPRH